METGGSTWKHCNTCKRPIGFRAPYFACSVSTCNRKGTDFVFCSVECWDAHVPAMRHRDGVWADEKTSPTTEEWAREQHEPRRIVVNPTPSSGGQARSAPAAGVSATERDESARVGTTSSSVPRDVLVVVSKLKQYIKSTSGMNTSDDVVAPLSDRLRLWCDDAVERARADGRKTVMARDFRRQS